jgi:anti-anti-sigma factor
MTVEGHSGLPVTRPLTGLAVLEVRCELDALNVPALSDLIRQLLDEDGRALLVDLYSCPFMGSAGLAALVEAADRAEATATRFGLVRPNRIASLALATTGLDSHFATYPSVTAAVVELFDGSA